MADAYTVHLDLERIRSNFSKADGREYTIDEVQAWLTENGFQQREHLWLCEEITLSLLDKSEILGKDLL